MSLLNFILISLAVIPALAFPVVYALTATFWKSILGRGFFIYATMFGVAMGLSLINRLLGDYPGRLAVSISVYALFTLGLWFNLLAYIITVRRVRNGHGLKLKGSK
jgi:hypothetical protein